jgi:hypothetical protein
MQTILLLREPLQLPAGDDAGAELTGSLSMTRDARNPRECRFTVVIDQGPLGVPVLQTWHMK